jgi:hypothetical protein
VCVDLKRNANIGEVVGIKIRRKTWGHGKESVMTTNEANGEFKYLRNKIIEN